MKLPLPKQLAKHTAKAQQVYGFFYQRGDEKPTKVEALEVPSHLEQRIAYCKGNEDARGREQATLEKLVKQKGQLEGKLREFRSAYNNEKVQRGAKTAVSFFTGNMLVPYLWHTLTDSKEDAACREQIQPAFVLQTLSLMTNAYLTFNAFVAPRLENFNATAEDISAKLNVIEKQITDCKTVLKHSDADYEASLPHTSSVSALQ